VSGLYRETIKTADWIIDLGPEAWPGPDPGAARRQVYAACAPKCPAGRKLALGLDPRVAAGAPEEVVKEKRSYTGAFLKPVLGRREASRKKGMVAAE
jgi:excinuclease ABC subunit A